MSALALALWYSSKAKLCWREGEKYFKQFRCPECVSSFEDSIEFATKAICEFLGENYNPKHDVSDALIRLSVNFPDYKEQLSRVAWISSRWVGMKQRARLLVRYGNQQAKVPATQIVTKKDIQPIRDDALETCNLLHKIETEKNFVHHPINVGILNGFVEDLDGLEKPCSVYPFVEFRIDDWEKRFSQITDVDGKNKYNVQGISVSEVSNEVAIIINPFGEAYPEKDVKKRFAFNLLKDYVADGGLLVNTGGFPFFYAWDVSEGRQQPIVDVTTLVPERIGITDGKVVIDRFKTLLNFAGSLFWREFDALTTGDTQEFSGINELKVYQTKEDKKIAGDLINVGGRNKINEFRALRKETKGLIPLLRASRPDFGEVYPIAAVQHGWGYLIVGGMHTKTNVEFEKLVVALDNFCSWLPKNV